MSACLCLLVRTVLDSPANRRAIKHIKEPGMQAGTPADRGATLTHEGSPNVHLLVNLESGDMYAFTSELESLPAEEEEGDLTVVLLMPHVGAVESSALSVAVRVACRVCFLCVSACVSRACSASLFTEHANRKVVAMSIILGWRPMGLQAGIQWPGRGIPGPWNC